MVTAAAPVIFALALILGPPAPRRGVERQELKWLAYAGAVLAGAILVEGLVQWLGRDRGTLGAVLGFASSGWWTGASTSATTTPPGTIAAFSARLRHQLDLDALATEMLTVVDQTMQPTTASLWLRPSMEHSGRSTS